MKGREKMLEIGFVKIDRKITQWRWYHDANTFRVFFHLIITANYEDKDFETITIKRGERVISYSKLSNELGLTEQNIRTAIKHLKETGEVTVKSHAKFSVVTINNYNQYQSANSQLTDNQQATNRQLTGNQQATNNNERNKESNKDKESKKDKEGVQSDKPTASSPSPSQISEIVDLYHKICTSYPEVAVVSDEIKKSLKNLIGKYSVEQIITVFETAEKSDFLKGIGKKDWKASFEWLVKEKNFVKVLNGNYNNPQKYDNSNGFNAEDYNIVFNKF